MLSCHWTCPKVARETAWCSFGHNATFYMALEQFRQASAYATTSKKMRTNAIMKNDDVEYSVQAAVGAARCRSSVPKAIKSMARHAKLQCAKLPSLASAAWILSRRIESYSSVSRFHESLFRKQSAKMLNAMSPVRHVPAILLRKVSKLNDDELVGVK